MHVINFFIGFMGNSHSIAVCLVFPQKYEHCFFSLQGYTNEMTRGEGVTFITNVFLEK